MSKTPAMGSLVPTFAAALGVPERTERERQRVLRHAGLIPGRHQRGPAAARMTPRGLAVVVMAHLCGDQPTLAAEDVRRGLGLMAVVDGQDAYLVDAIEAAFVELIEHGEPAGVRDMRIAVGSPWPVGVMTLRHADGAVTSTQFHHIEARATGFPKRDAAQLTVLQQKWHHRPGVRPRWGLVTLDQMKRIADVAAGRAPLTVAHAPPIAEAPSPEPALWS